MFKHKSLKLSYLHKILSFLRAEPWQMHLHHLKKSQCQIPSSVGLKVCILSALIPSSCSEFTWTSRSHCNNITVKHQYKLTFRVSRNALLVSWQTRLKYLHKYLIICHDIWCRCPWGPEVRRHPWVKISYCQMLWLLTKYLQKWHSHQPKLRGEVLCLVPKKPKC